MSRPQPRTIVAFVDAIDRERGVARLVEGERGGALPAHSFPAALLPAGLREGAWIELRITPVDAPAGEDPTALRKKLGQDDDGGDLKL